MSNLSSMSLTAALSNGFQSLFSSGQRHNRASQDILQSTVDTINDNYSSSSIQDTVSISSMSENISDSPSLENGILELSKAGITYNASAKLITATNSAFDTLFEAIA
jgi:hypothetical protein